MKKLLIVRHAKSSWEHTELSDFDRPLNPRGLRNCPEMSYRLSQRQIKVEQIFTSAARRAFETAKGISEGLGLSPLDIQPKESLYHATEAEYTLFVQQLNNTYQSVAIIGHNPDLTAWVNSLAGTPIENVPTLGMAMIEFEQEDWADITAGKGDLLWYDFPKKPFKLS